MMCGIWEPVWVSTPKGIPDKQPLFEPIHWEEPLWRNGLSLAIGAGRLVLVVRWGNYSSHFKTEKVYAFPDLQRRNFVIEIIKTDPLHAWRSLLSEGSVIWFPWHALVVRNTLFSPVLGWETPHRYPEAFALNHTSQKQLGLYRIWL